ncbi:TolB family protein [Flavobacteriaceae bacterium LMO-SS05]
MKYHCTFVFVLTSFISFAQANTEVFLFDLNQENGAFQLSNFKNISNSEGYDNQPSFLDDNTILYAGTRNGQTDIVNYTISSGEKHWICETEGSEYSPLKIPNQNAISAIQLDKNGTQVLRTYNLDNGESEVLVDDIIIGYHVWYSENRLLSSVLEDEGLSLYSADFKMKENRKLEAKVGRSLHNIPNSNLASFISKEKDSIWSIKSMDPFSGDIEFIINTLPKSEDMCWTPNGTIFMAKDSVLFKFNPKRDKDWVKITSLNTIGIKNITRLAVNPNGTKLALVGELSIN